MRRDASAEFRAGARAVLPAVIAVVPFGLLLGALAAQKGLSPIEVMLMSGLVFAGSSQFIAVDIWTEPAPWLLVTVSALLVNSRHLLMGASLGPKIGHFRGIESLVSLFLMADEVWALAERRAGVQRLSFAYMLGLGGVLWLNWVAWTGLGAMVGMVVRDPAALGFDFAFTAIFLTLLVGLWRGPRTGIAIAAGGVAGALAGAAVGSSEDPLPEVAE